MSSKPEKPRAMSDCLWGMLAQRRSLGVLERARQRTKSKRRRASELLVSLPKPSTILWYLSTHFRLGLCYCCATGWVLPLPESRGPQRGHFPLKAIHCQGLERRCSPGSRQPWQLWLCHTSL